MVRFRSDDANRKTGIELRMLSSVLCVLTLSISRVTVDGVVVSTYIQ